MPDSSYKIQYRPIVQWRHGPVNRLYPDSPGNPAGSSNQYWFHESPDHFVPGDQYHLHPGYG